MEQEELSLKERCLMGDVDAIVALHNKHKDRFGSVEITGKELDHGVLFSYSRPENANSEKPPVLIVVGIRNHYNEARTQIASLLDKGAPAVHILHYSYKEKLNVQRFFNTITDVIQDNPSIALCGICSGATILPEYVNRLPNFQREHIAGLFCISPVLSEHVKFLPRHTMRLISALASNFEPTTLEKMFAWYSKVKDVVDDPVMSTPNTALLYNIERELTLFKKPVITQSSQNGIRNIAVSWVSTGEEYVKPDKMKQIETRIATLGSQPIVYANMPGRHGDIDQPRNRVGYQDKLAEWYAKCA